MPGIIPGYEYDIFISYRQKDNKGDRWVSEFVEALETELESTFKEDIRVYFDINPHDGLLETYDVDASLQDKLKCLVFIPVISRTYCDPRSFAWENEFRAFVGISSHDRFGLKVKIPNGNIVSRVLPVLIYDLDPEDIQLCETILGGFLRGVEFIYREPGVNRPLRPNDDEKVNLNKTKYLNQINKVANAIKEIIGGIKLIQSDKTGEKTSLDKESVTGSRRDNKPGTGRSWKVPGKTFSMFVLAAVLVVTLLILYPKVFNKASLEKLKSSGLPVSVAVMPFQNLTNDTLWNVWQTGIQNEMISALSSNSTELRVRQIESVKNLLDSRGIKNYASVTPEIAGVVSRKLNANIFISGSIKQSGGILRLNAQLMDSGTKEIFKSFQVDGSPDKILNIADSLAILVKDALLIARMEKEMSPDYKHLLPTNSAEAYRYYISGENAFHDQDFLTAIQMDSQAFAIDTNFVQAAIAISISYYDLEKYKQAKKWFARVSWNKDRLPIWGKIVMNRLNAMLNETPAEEIRYHRQLLEIDDQLPNAYYAIGIDYAGLYQFDKAIPEFEKALDIYKGWNIKPMWAYNYSMLEYFYFMTGQYKKLEKLARDALRDYPDDFLVNGAQIVISLVIEKDSAKADKYLERSKSILRERKVADSDIASQLGLLSKRVQFIGEAEKYYRQALALEPRNPDKMNDLASLLIGSDINVNEGLRLIDSALLKDPINYEYLRTKGWGLYKKAMYGEALGLLERSWVIRREDAIYDHEAFLQLEAARNAVSASSSK